MPHKCHAWPKQVAWLNAESRVGETCSSFWWEEVQSHMKKGAKRGIFTLRGGAKNAAMHTFCLSFSSYQDQGVVSVLRPWTVGTFRRFPPRTSCLHVVTDVAGHHDHWQNRTGGWEI
jgi:hypothetical protein